MTDRTDRGTARLLFSEHLVLALVFWLVSAALVAVVVVMVAARDAVTVSGWDRVYGLYRLVAVCYGYHLARRVLPVHVAHGQTRRGFLAQGGLFVGVLAALLAGLVTSGYWLEGVLYRAAGWPQAISADRMFDTGTEYGAIVVSWFLLLLGWTLAGAVLGAGFGRSADAGVAGVVGAAGVLLLVTLASHGIPFLADPVLPDDSLAVSVLVAGAAVLAGLSLTWAVARDTPLRPADD